MDNIKIKQMNNNHILNNFYFQCHLMIQETSLLLSQLRSRLKTLGRVKQMLLYRYYLKLEQKDIFVGIN